MNTHTDLRWILFATVPVNGYANADPVTPIARGIVWLYRRAGAQVKRLMFRRAAGNVAA